MNRRIVQKKKEKEEGKNKNFTPKIMVESGVCGCLS